MYDFDLFVIGAGSGGVAASRRAASCGARVGICEGSKVGGTCVLRGCIPKKLLMYGGQFQDNFVDSYGFGWDVDRPRVNWSRLFTNKDLEINRLSQLYIEKLENTGVSLYASYGRLVNAYTVQIGEQTYTSRHILLATGSRPVKLPIPGNEYALTSDEALELPKAPAKLTIIGGGYIAMEFAHIFSALGVDITVLIRAQHILNGFDDDLRITLEEEMSTRGIHLEKGFHPIRIESQGEQFTVIASDGRMISNTLVMMATGRKPNTHHLGLENVGVMLNSKGAILVDANSKTSIDNIYAIGDVTDRVPLTPVAIAEGRAFAETLYNHNPMQVNYDHIPTAVFSLPPLASVGLTETQARRTGKPIDIYRTRFRPLKHTLSGRKEYTLIKLITDQETDRVLGCHMLGQDSPEIIQGLAVALTCGATKHHFNATMALHPSAAEEFVTLR